MSKILTAGGVANQLVRPTSTGLVYVRNDSVYETHRRAGRFAMQKEAAASFEHLYATIMAQQEKMIAGLARRGFAYTGSDFEIHGPLEHIFISEDSTIDPGPDKRPDPRDLDRLRVYERAERARVALRLDESMELVDYELVGEFRVKVAAGLHRAA